MSYALLSLGHWLSKTNGAVENGTVKRLCPDEHVICVEAILRSVAGILEMQELVAKYGSQWRSIPNGRLLN